MPVLPPTSSYKPMANKDYGLFLQRMRKSRGFTQDHVVAVSGVSISTLRTLESSGDKITIRPANLDAILTSLAMRGYLGPSEIKVLCEATDRVWESFEDLNFRAEQLKNESSNDLRTRPTSTEPDYEQRFMNAARALMETDQATTALTIIEALAAQAGIQLASDKRAPKSTTNPPARTLRVAHPPKTGPFPGSVQQEFTDYEVTEEPKKSVNNNKLKKSGPSSEVF